MRSLVPVALCLVASACSLNPHFDLTEVVPVSSPTLLAEVPFHPQQAHHCGPAALLSQLEAAGTEIDYQSIVDRVYVPELEGSLQVEMLAAARSFGHVAYTLPPEPAAVLAEVEAGRPVLVLLNLRTPSRPVWHYALVLGFDPASNELILHSGRTANSRQKAPAWLRRWDWAGRWSMVLLEPGEWPASVEREPMLRALSAFEETAAPQAAEIVWRAAVDHWPEEPIAQLGLGNSLQRQGQDEQARSAFRAAFAIDQGYLPARLNLAFSLAEDARACDARDALGEPPERDYALSSEFADLAARLDRECGQQKPPTTAEVIANSSADDWRPLDAGDTLYLELAGNPEGGRVVIELAPEFAPAHVANIRALARGGYWDGLAILRSQENYVVQWGDPDAEDEQKRKSLGEAKSTLPAEFARPSEDLQFTPLADGDVYAPEAGWSAGFPAARDPETGEAWLVHCYSMVGAGRGMAADSSTGAELYVVIGHSPRHLDRNITLVGRVVQGMDLLSTLPRGTGPLGFYEDSEQYIPIRSIRLAAEVPEAERVALEVFRTDTEVFQQLVESRRNRREEWFHQPLGRIGVCNVPIPTRSRHRDRSQP